MGRRADRINVQLGTEVELIHDSGIDVCLPPRKIDDQKGLDFKSVSRTNGLRYRGPGIVNLHLTFYHSAKDVMIVELIHRTGRFILEIATGTRHNQLLQHIM